jgi:hypothetical protein
MKERDIVSSSPAKQSTRQHCTYFTATLDNKGLQPLAKNNTFLCVVQDCCRAPNPPKDTQQTLKPINQPQSKTLPALQPIFCKTHLLEQSSARKAQQDLQGFFALRRLHQPTLSLGCAPQTATSLERSAAARSAGIV